MNTEQPPDDTKTGPLLGLGSSEGLGGCLRQQRMEARMGKWIERAAIAALVLIVVVVLIGMHATWCDCNAAGGQTVRGLFGLECIKS